jgi:hypothetical protein
MLSTWPIAGFDLLGVSVRTPGAGARGVLAQTVEKNDRLKAFIVTICPKYSLLYNYDSVEIINESITVISLFKEEPCVDFFPIFPGRTKIKTIRGKFLPTSATYPFRLPLAGIPFLTDILSIVPTILKVYFAE